MHRTHAIHTISFAARPVFVPTTVGVTFLASDDPQARAADVVLLTELRINAGRSVTNAVEDLASAIAQRLDDARGRPLAEADPEGTVWLEMYSDRLSRSATGRPGFTLDWVELEWARGTRYRHPQWTRLLSLPGAPEAPLPTRLAQRLAWIGRDVLAALEAEARQAEAMFHAELRNLALEVPLVREIVS